MKKYLSLLVVLSLIFTSCTSATVTEESVITTITSENLANSNSTESAIAETTSTQPTETTVEETTTTTTAQTDIEVTESTSEVTTLTSEPSSEFTFTEISPEYQNLNDPDLLAYLEDEVYRNTILKLNSADYVLDEVKASYISQEYIEELAFNSQENVYFGYTLSELNTLFDCGRFAFTMGEDGNTTVYEVEEDKFIDKYSLMLKNVAVGTGVIVILVTANLVAPQVGAPASVQLIISFATKGAIIGASSSAAISTASTLLIRGLETQNFDISFEDALLAGTEGFEMGAIFGAASGAISESVSLAWLANKTNMTIEQIATIQLESQLPMSVIKSMNSYDEYLAIRDANLTVSNINGRSALIRDIDLDFLDELGRTNRERIRNKLAPQFLDENGNYVSYELHHIGQNTDGPLAILRPDEHKLIPTPDPGIDHGAAWKATKEEFWETYVKMFS